MRHWFVALFSIGAFFGPLTSYEGTLVSYCPELVMKMQLLLVLSSNGVSSRSRVQPGRVR